MNNETIMIKVLSVIIIFGISYALVHWFPFILTIIITAIASLLLIKKESLWKN